MACVWSAHMHVSGLFLSASRAGVVCLSFATCDSMKCVAQGVRTRSIFR